MHFGHAVRAARLRPPRFWSQFQLAKVSGVGESTIKAIEGGRPPSAINRAKLLATFPELRRTEAMPSET